MGKAKAMLGQADHAGLKATGAWMRGSREGTTLGFQPDAYFFTLKAASLRGGNYVGGRAWHFLSI